MAGSYRHATTENGQLRKTITIETQGDTYETIEEFYGMVWYLAAGNSELVEQARQNYQLGIEISPGYEEE